jgi:tRNA (adenine22-N1)-methyltransferase
MLSMTSIAETELLGLPDLSQLEPPRPPREANGTSTVLDARLSAVAEMVADPRVGTVADIGTDHALLPRFLLENRLADRVIAVEKHARPAAVARAALRGFRAEVRLGDGLEALLPGEVECATLCGMGGWLIASLLSRHSERVPARLVLQANRDTPLLRVWAAERGYHLREERMVAGHWNFVILSLLKASGPDPAYKGLPLELAVEFGPHLLRQRHPLLCQEVVEREAYFRGTRAVRVHGLLCQAREFLGV